MSCGALGPFAWQADRRLPRGRKGKAMVGAPLLDPARAQPRGGLLQMCRRAEGSKALPMRLQNGAMMVPLLETATMAMGRLCVLLKRGPLSRRPPLPRSQSAHRMVWRCRLPFHRTPTALRAACCWRRRSRLRTSSAMRRERERDAKNQQDRGGCRARGQPQRRSHRPTPPQHRHASVAGHLQRRRTPPVPGGPPLRPLFQQVTEVLPPPATFPHLAAPQMPPCPTDWAFRSANHRAKPFSSAMTSAPERSDDK